ncbi:MAG: peptidoglycan-binding protein [Cyanobacteria bacterium J06627_8]
MILRITPYNPMRLLSSNHLMNSAALFLALSLPLLATPFAIAQTPTNASPANSSTTNGDRPLLQLGSDGQEVEMVQAMLTLLGFYRGPIDGRFSDTTTLAVANFQQAAGIVVDGIVGRSTWERLLPSINPTSPSTGGTTQPPTAVRPSANTVSDRPQSANTSENRPDSNGREPSSTDESIPYVEFPVLRRGMRGAAVIGLQARLQSLGFYFGPTDGIFGRQTEEAVMAAQEQLDLSADGVVGSATWAAITPSRRD